SDRARLHYPADSAAVVDPRPLAQGGLGAAYRHGADVSVCRVRLDGRRLQPRPHLAVARLPARLFLSRVSCALFLVETKARLTRLRVAPHEPFLSSARRPACRPVDCPPAGPRPAAVALLRLFVDERAAQPGRGARPVPA